MTRRAALALMALSVAACNRSCDSWYGELNMAGDVTIVAENGLRFPVQMAASQRELEESPPDLSTDLPLRGELADLWLRLDQTPDGKGTYTVTEAMLRLGGPRPEHLSLPRGGWGMKGELVVSQDRSEDVPPLEERNCSTYFARQLQGMLTLQIRSAQGHEYRINDAALELTQEYTCRPFHF